MVVFEECGCECCNDGQGHVEGRAFDEDLSAGSVKRSTA